MKGFMVKDVILMKNQGKSLLFLLAIGLFMEFEMQGGTIIWFMTFLGAMLVAGTLSYDEYDNGMSFLFTLPISRRTYVREKYLFSLLFPLVCLAISTLLSLVMHRSVADAMKMDDLFAMTGIATLVASLLLATLLPLRLRFGSEQSKIVWFLFFGVVVALGAGGAKLSKSMTAPIPALRPLSVMIRSIEAWSAVKLLGVCALIALVLLLISEQISERIMIHKEL